MNNLENLKAHSVLLTEEMARVLVGGCGDGSPDGWDSYDSWDFGDSEDPLDGAPCDPQYSGPNNTPADPSDTGGC